MKTKRLGLIAALDGRFDDHHAELARMLLDQIDALTAQIDTLTARIEQLSPPGRRTRQRRCPTAPLGRRTAQPQRRQPPVGVDATTGRCLDRHRHARWRG